MSESNLCKSDLSERCAALESVLLYRAGRKSGVHLAMMINWTTMATRPAVLARRSAQDEPILFRLCPYCGVAFDAAKPAAPAPEAPAPDENPGLVDAIRQAERETKAIERQSQAIREKWAIDHPNDPKVTGG